MEDLVSLILSLIGLLCAVSFYNMVWRTMRAVLEMRKLLERLVKVSELPPDHPKYTFRKKDPPT